MKGKELRRVIRARAAAGLPALLARLPAPVGRGFCVWVGRAAHRLVGRDRCLARENLRRVFGWEEGRLRREARMVFEELGRNIYDFARYPRLSPAACARLVTIEGREHLDRACAAGRGVVLVAPHLGSWELLAAHLAREGYPFLALARPLREPRLEARLAAHRRALGFGTLPDRGGLLRAARHLRSGGVLGILADQRVKNGAGLTVRFLGQPTRIAEGPARLALATGAAVVPAGIRRLDDDRHRITVRPPLELPEGENAVAALTQDIADALGALILEAPRQWIWIHPRWTGEGEA